MKRPTTSTEQMLATASNGVSSTLACAVSDWVWVGSLGARVFCFDILLLFGIAPIPRSNQPIHSAHHTKDAAPTRKSCQAFSQFPFVSESIIRGLLSFLLRIGCRG